jgi:hypothetical protein
MHTSPGSVWTQRIAWFATGITAGCLAETCEDTRCTWVYCTRRKVWVLKLPSGSCPVHSHLASGDV